MTENLYRAVLLAPYSGPTAPAFESTTTSHDEFETFLSSAQCLRGTVYLADGAIRANQMDDRGRFAMPGDRDCWHFLLVDSQDSVVGCARYHLHLSSVRYDDLRISRTALAGHATWGDRLRISVENTLRNARDRNFYFVELGGWALSGAHRGTKAALQIMLASYAWTQLMGGCLGMCTATVRHGSSSILRRVGGFSLTYLDQPMPVYMDPDYGCHMEALSFDSEIMEGRFSKLVQDIKNELLASPIIRARQSSRLDTVPEIAHIPAPSFGRANDFETNMILAY